MDQKKDIHYLNGNSHNVSKNIQILRHLKSYFIYLLFRMCSIKCLRSIIKLFVSPWFEFRTFESVINYTKQSQIKFLYDELSYLYYCEPVFNHLHALKPELTSVIGPNKYAVILDSVSVIGGSNLILLNTQKVLYDIKYNDKAKRFWYSDRAIIYYTDEFCVLDAVRKTNEFISELDEGISMVANFSWNYYHLIFEILVRLEQIYALKIDKNIPLLIDKVCMETPQYLELFTMLDKDHRKLIALEDGRRYLVKKLYYISCPNSIPPNFKNVKDIKAEDLLFDLKTILNMRISLLAYSVKTESPKRIFISRSKASTRRQFNEDDVFQVLEKFDFTKVYPENYSIANQIAMFNNAEFIAGGSGAAFANLLFCKKSCKVVIFSKFKIPFSGFSTIASYIGIELLYFTEYTNSVYEMKDPHLHESFQINTCRLITLMADWIQ